MARISYLWKTFCRCFLVSQYRYTFLVLIFVPLFVYYYQKQGLRKDITYFVNASPTRNVINNVALHTDSVLSDTPFYSLTDVPRDTDATKLQTLSEEPLTCVFPKFDPFEPSVMKVAGLDQEPVKCEGAFMPDITYVQDNVLLVNDTLVDTIIGRDFFNGCRYREIFKPSKDDKSFAYGVWNTLFTNKSILPENTEFIVVECLNDSTKIVSKSYFSFIPRKKQYKESDSLNAKKRLIEGNVKETLNIIMVGFDTVSRYHFLRSFEKTYLFLVKNLTSFDLSMHNQLGENTFPNFIPLFTGRSVKETNRWWKYYDYMDALDFIWPKFETAGYKTLYTEDEPIFGAFHYLNRGFQAPLARYYMRPLALAIEADKEFWSNNFKCAGNKFAYQYQLDYLGNFIDKFFDDPVFGVAMLSKMTHDYPVNAKQVDPYIYNFYTSLKDKGYLNKTLLITFSDHGPRWGPLRQSVNGIFESRTPFIILTFPEWFLKKYPDVAENLKVNTKRLTTHFDTHATLLDLLYFKSDNPPPLPPLKHGISLFKKIPENRSCLDVPIDIGYCLCGLKNEERIDVKSNLSQMLALMLLDTINSRRDPNICAVFSLKSIMQISRYTIEETVSNQKHYIKYYKITLEVVPGSGTFEGNVYIKNSSFLEVGEDITRTNLYKGQSQCVNDANYKPFCYCKNLL